MNPVLESQRRALKSQGVDEAMKQTLAVKLDVDVKSRDLLDMSTNVDNCMQWVATEKFQVGIINANNNNGLFKAKRLEFDPDTKRTYKIPEKKVRTWINSIEADLNNTQCANTHVIINFRSLARHKCNAEVLQLISSLCELEQKYSKQQKVVYEKKIQHNDKLGDIRLVLPSVCELQKSKKKINEGTGWITTNILSQEEEAKLAQLALEEYAKHKDPSNQELANVTHKTIMADDMNDDSGQNLHLLPKQTKEFGGKWACDQARNGQTLEEISQLAKFKIEKDLKSSVAKRRHDLGVIGLSAKALGNKKVVKALKINGDNRELWKKGQIIRPLSSVISALQTAIKKYDQEMNSSFDRILEKPEVKALIESEKKKSLEEKKESNISNIDRKILISYLLDEEKILTLEQAADEPCVRLQADYKNFEENLTPLAITLGKYQAYIEKYKKDWNVLTICSKVKLYNPITQQMDKTMKPNVSFGAATQFFTEADKTLTKYGKTKRSDEMKTA